MKYTIKHFQKAFPNDDVCLAYMFARRWASKPCPSCGRTGTFSRIVERKQYACICGFQVAPTVGSIFEKSSTPLTLWFFAIYLFSQSKNGVSAKELQRQTGVTYKTAWRMAHEIRKLMEETSKKSGGTFEVDETYVGGRSKGTVGRGTKKRPVFGIVKRGGKIVTRHLPNVVRKNVMPVIFGTAAKGSTICSDEYHLYKHAFPNMTHKTVNHGGKQWVSGVAHTNNLEGYWSHFKRALKGTYVHVSPKYLQAYLNEFSYRYNHRASASPIFSLLLRKAAC